MRLVQISDLHLWTDAADPRARGYAASAAAQRHPNGGGTSRGL
jgi:3',5'-cyclic AMP phosphodiesterase CpdA